MGCLRISLEALGVFFQFQQTTTPGNSTGMLRQAFIEHQLCARHSRFFKSTDLVNPQGIREKSLITGRTIPPQRCPHPGPWNWWICYLHGGRVLDGMIKRRISRLERSAWIIQVAPKSCQRLLEEKWGGRGVRRMWDGGCTGQRLQDARLWLWRLRVGEGSGVKSQGKQAVSRSWKRQAIPFSSKVSRRRAALLASFYPRETHSMDFWPLEL